MAYDSVFEAKFKTVSRGVTMMVREYLVATKAIPKRGLSYELVCYQRDRALYRQRQVLLFMDRMLLLDPNGESWTRKDFPKAASAWCAYLEDISAAGAA